MKTYEAIVVDDEQQAKLKAQASIIPQQVKSHEIVDNASSVRAQDFLVRIVDVRKQINAMFDSKIKTAYDLHRSLVAWKKETEAPLAEAEAIVRQKVGAFLQEEERKRLAQIKEAQALADKQAKKDKVVAPVVTVAPTAVKSAGISTRHVAKYVIEDESILPREYLTADLKKIGAVVRANPDIKIKGVKVYFESSLSVNTSRATQEQEL